MKVILNENQIPQGIYLPIGEWEQLKTGINPNHELYQLMAEITRKDVFEMNIEEFKAHLAPVAEATAQYALEQGSYISYPANFDENPNIFIHEYANGKKIMIEIDEATGKEHFLKNL